MLFTERLRDQILSGVKTQTRRYWKRKPPKVGSIVFAQTKLFKNDTRFARIKILRVWEWDGETISDDDVMAEGFLSFPEFMREYYRLNNGCKDPLRTHYAVEFEVVEKIQEETDGNASK